MGEGPAVVLVHGIAGRASTWDGVMPALSVRHRVVAPDLLGHGRSEAAAGDFSLGAYASEVRDLMVMLGVGRATLVGHSLGGGVVLQFAYQFPDLCERIVLVSSGGLGRELHPVLRAGALPGASIVLPWLCAAGEQTVGRAVQVLGRLGVTASSDLQETWRSFVSLGDAGARQAFLQTVRGLIDVGGQRVTATAQLYLTAGLPVLIVWGARDRLIPVSHGLSAHELIAGSRMEVFPEAGHYPFLDDPERFAHVLLDFMRTTRPRRIDLRRFGRHLRGEAEPS